MKINEYEYKRQWHSGYDEEMPVFEPHAKLDTLYHFFFWAFFSTVSCLFSKARISPMTPE